MTKQVSRLRSVALLMAMLCLVLFAGPAGAVEMLQNNGFENYDPGTLVPDDWQVIDGNVETFTDYAHSGAASVYSLGGTMVGGVDTPNPPQSGTLVQLIDLSTLPDWGTVNWLGLSISMNYRLIGATRITMYLEYLPSDYDTETVTADDPAWSGADAQIASSRIGSVHAYSSYPWYTTSATGLEIPRVRWARVRFVYDVTFQSNSRFTDGEYYIALDTVSVDAEAILAETPCSDNLLVNPGFESVSGGEPADWYVLAGRMTALDHPLVPPYAGDYYTGNIGGYVDPNPGGDPINYPDDPQNGTLVQVVDLSSAIADWTDATFIAFSFGNRYLRKGISGLNAIVEYLPPAYDALTVTWDDAAWESDAQPALRMALSNTGGLWKSFQTDQGTMPKVRWVRVRLEVDSVRDVSFSDGEYMGGFDQVCFQAQSVITEALLKNPSFEDKDVNNKPIDWYEDPGDGPLHLGFEPVPPYDGSTHLWKFNDGTSTGRVYQVIDLADKIPGWNGIDYSSGSAVELHFIQLALSAHLFNVGGTSVRVCLEYLPNSYNAVDGITWDNAAWAPRDWVSDGAAFTNAGGDAIDLGTLIEDTTVSTDPVWREATYSGWLPRVRWLRLRIELDATLTTGSTPYVGIDAINLSALCTQTGPYSGFGDLPEATFYEAADAPDKAIPAWVGPEGDGISGGYTGQTERNYVNPAFAGFADNYVNYIPSGENIYNTMFMEPLAITGRPYNDAGWVYVIVTMGDMGIASLADHFGPAPSGLYNPGEITATFNEAPIVNGPGPDFATFENGFSQGWTSPFIFAELAYVEVSSNGTDFIRFPTHSLTPKLARWLWHHPGLRRVRRDRQAYQCLRRPVGHTL